MVIFIVVLFSFFYGVVVVILIMVFLMDVTIDILLVGVDRWCVV